MHLYALVVRWSAGRGAVLGEHAAQGLHGNYRDVATQLLAAADRASRQQSYLCDNFRFCCMFVEDYGFLCLAAAQSALSDQFAYLDSLCAALLPSLQTNSESLETQRQIVQVHFNTMYPLTAAAAVSALPVHMCLPPLALERVQCYTPATCATTTATAATIAPTIAASPTLTNDVVTAFDPFAELFPTSTSQPNPATASVSTAPPASVGFNPFDDFAVAAEPAPPSEGCWLDQFSSEPVVLPALSLAPAPGKGAARPRWGSKDDIDVLFIPAPAPLPEAGGEATFANNFHSINGNGQATNVTKSHRRRSSEPKQLPDSHVASSIITHESTYHSARARSSDDRPRTPKRGTVVADVGLILPIDYSGMSDDGSADGAKLLSKLDTQVKNALVTQLGIASSYDEVMTVLHIFREILANVPLPPAMSVRFEQAVKDANRERILLGKRLFTSDSQSLWDALQDTVRPLVVGGDEMIVEAVCKDILRASSRTASGGDSYSIISCLFGNEDVVITPAPVECRPIAITIDREAFVISIVSEDKFVMRRVDEMEPSSQFEPSAAVDGPSAPSSGKPNTRGKSPKSFGFLFGKRSSHKPHSAIAELPQNEQISELHPQGRSLSLTSTITTELRLVDTMNPCIRTLSITTDLVEQTPEQLIVLGAGDPRVNKNPYELQGFRNRSPWYLNSAGVHFTLEHLPADDTWLWAIGVPPVCLYLCAGECGQMPPLEGWQPQCDAVPEPAPTVMPSSKRLTKKRSTPSNLSQQAVAETPLSAQFKIFGRRLSISSATSSADDDRRTPKNANTPDRRVVTDIMNSVFEHEEKAGSSSGSEPIAPLPLMDLGCVPGTAPVPPIDTRVAHPCSSDASSVGSPGMCSPVAPITVKAVEALDSSAAGHETKDLAPIPAVHTPTSGSQSSNADLAASAATPEYVGGGDSERGTKSGGKRFKPPWRWFDHGHGSAATSPARSPAPVASSEMVFERPRHPTTSALPRPGSAGQPSYSERSVSVPPASGGHRLKGLPQFAIRPWRKGNADRATAATSEDLSNDSDDEGMTYGIMATFSSKLEDDSP